MIEEKEMTNEEVKEKLSAFENMSVADLKGPARLEGESFDDYQLRRYMEKNFVKVYCQGVAIKKHEGMNRAQKRMSWKNYKKHRRHAFFEGIKDQRKMIKCPKCFKHFPKYEIAEHVLDIHKMDYVLPEDKIVKCEHGHNETDCSACGW